MGIEVVDRVLADEEINGASIAMIGELFSKMAGKLVKQVSHEEAFWQEEQVHMGNVDRRKKRKADKKAASKAQPSLQQEAEVI